MSTKMAKRTDVVVSELTNSGTVLPPDPLSNEMISFLSLQLLVVEYSVMFHERHTDKYRHFTKLGKSGQASERKCF